VRYFPLSLLLLAVTPAAAAPDLHAIHEQYRDNVVAITYTLRPKEKPRGGQGRKVEEAICGVLLDDKGLVLTSADPFPEPGGDPRTTLAPVEFEVHARDGKIHKAEVVGLDRELNLAWLRLTNPPPGIRALDFSRQTMQVGDVVVVIGVLAKKYGYEPVLYTGFVNAVLARPRSMYSLDLHVQDLAIGGLVLSQAGRPIGIIGEDILEETPTSERTPGNTLSIFGSFTQGRRVGYPMVFPWSIFADKTTSPPPLEAAESRSWLGVVMQPLDEDLIDYWKLNVDGGIILASVVDGSPAARAGLQTADILVAIEGEPLHITRNEQLAEFRRRVERMGVGRAVGLTYMRAGEKRDVSITLDEAPKTAWTVEEEEDEGLGLTVREITMDDILGQNLEGTVRGVVVSEMERAGPAHLSGLQTGDIIQAVDRHPVTDLASWRGEAERVRDEKNEAILLLVQRQTETLFVRLRTPKGLDSGAP